MSHLLVRPKNLASGHRKFLAPADDISLSFLHLASRRNHQDTRLASERETGLEADRVSLTNWRKVVYPRFLAVTARW